MPLTSAASASFAFCHTKSGNLTSCSLTSTYRHYVCILCQHLTALQYLLLICCYTLSRPPTISSLKTTDRSFRYASPCLRNQFPDSFRQPQQSRLDSPPHPLVNPSLSPSPLSSSTTPSLFHSRLKTYLFNKSFPPY